MCFQEGSGMIVIVAGKLEAPRDFFQLVPCLGCGSWCYAGGACKHMGESLNPKP